ncbi:hypothetical protein F511_04264 [Dorcoceras hygrometricum]|uniref:DNA-directed RNA polymerase V subunit 1 n=1 Tax=Dorcoceras hygrometricum TaxID=472368 RepID=A0A2Z7CYL9_9LAMI|nr:hypothetical protein F511_04264 [Dorcoceras hygrometricum]
MSLFDLQDVCIAMGSLATLDLPMVVDLIGIYGLKGPYSMLTTTDWFLQALSVIPRGSWGDVARRFTMIRWVVDRSDLIGDRSYDEVAAIDIVIWTRARWTGPSPIMTPYERDNEDMLAGMTRILERQSERSGKSHEEDVAERSARRDTKNLLGEICVLGVTTLELLDSGVTHSFISSTFIQRMGVIPKSLGVALTVTIPSGEVALDSSREALSFYTIIGGCCWLERDREVAVFGRWNSDFSGPLIVVIVLGIKLVQRSSRLDELLLASGCHASLLLLFLRLDTMSTGYTIVMKLATGSTVARDCSLRPDFLLYDVASLLRLDVQATCWYLATAGLTPSADCDDVTDDVINAKPSADSSARRRFIFCASLHLLIAIC